MTSAQVDEVRYDPHDNEIDRDPYPVFRRLRDEAPLYYNEQYDFFALSRYDDVRACSFEWQTYISGKGSVLEFIKSGIEIPSGTLLFEDPPTHDHHRGILARVFTPKRIAALEPAVREFCVRALDPHVGTGRLDFIADLGAEMPMKTIGMLLGIPESDQTAVRERIDEGLKLRDGQPVVRGDELYDFAGKGFAEYVDWRVDHPSDDLMSALLQAEYEDEHGVTRKLDRGTIIGYVGVLAGAGAETTTRLIGWAGKLLAEHPDQRRQVAADPALIPQVVEELLRYESPSPVQARYVTGDVEHHGITVPQGSTILLLTASANRDERQFADPDRFDIHRDRGQHVAFGYGIHHCLGAHLARLEARVALEEVLKRWPTWDIDWENAEQAHTSTVRGWARLPAFVPAR